MTLRATIGKYLPDLVFGANDGIVTTLAVVSGVVGASLSSTVILILGFANLVADGFSMGASNVLSRRSDTGPDLLPPLSVVSHHGLATFVGFVIAGVVPLLAYCFPLPKDIQFEVAGLLALATLFIVGASRAAFTKRHWLPSGMEMLVLGSIAAAIAYGIGALGAAVIRHTGP
ncbi:MAG: VIT1/CCC1 transporter family protein [Tardiphaga sp.]